MEQRAADFVEIMIVFAVIGVLAFLIALLVRAPARQQAAAAGTVAPPQSPRWYEFTLALILLAAAAALAIWLISSGNQWPWGETIGNWQADTRTIVFAALMVALAVVGLGLSLAYALQKKIVDMEVVKEVVSDLDISKLTSPPDMRAEPVPSATSRNFDGGTPRQVGDILSPADAAAYMQDLALKLRNWQRSLEDAVGVQRSPQSRPPAEPEGS